MKRSEVRHKVQNISLGFLAGYVDTLGFVALFGLFVGHITGNFVLIGAEMAQPQGGPLLMKFLAFPAYILGVAIARLQIASLIKHGHHALVSAYVLQILLLCLFMILGTMALPIGPVPTLHSELAGMAGALAMGTHSACSRLLLSHQAPTAMMTGNVTQLVIDATDWLRGAADERIKERCIKILWPVVAFGFGAVAAAFSYQLAHFYALIVPIGILLYLCYLERGAIKKLQKNPPQSHVDPSSR